MTIVAAYDVSDDNRRARLAAVLQTWGDRVQFSVFMVTVSDDELTQLRAKAEAIIDPQTDSLYLFRQCADCWDGLDFVGQAHVPSEPLYWSAF